MSTIDERNGRELNPADLRGILKYVPQWRNHVFVLAIDGSVIAEDNFSNLMLEIAVLRNLNIRILVVYGIGKPIQDLAEARKIKISDPKGYGPTNGETLELAIEAAGLVGHSIERGLTQNGLRCARINAVRSTELGIMKGIDQGYTGKVDKVDAPLLLKLMEMETIPLLSPLAFSRDGETFRLNSDHLASEVAKSLEASKLIFLLPHPGLTIDGAFRLNADVAEIRDRLSKNPKSIDEAVRSKALHAVQTIDAGTPRAHIIDTRIEDGLLLEIFSKVGIGTMIHSNPYTQIRPARRKDAAAIHAITRSAVRNESLRPRTRQNIEASIADYFVYEVDESVIGCFRLSSFSKSKTAELGSVFVHPAYKGRKIGQVLVEFALSQAKTRQLNKVIALTTQTYPFFRNVCGFEDGSLKDLPKPLRETYLETKRQSKILRKSL